MQGRHKSVVNEKHKQSTYLFIGKSIHTLGTVNSKTTGTKESLVLNYPTCVFLSRLSFSFTLCLGEELH